MKKYIIFISIITVICCCILFAGCLTKDEQYSKVWIDYDVFVQYVENAKYFDNNGKATDKNGTPEGDYVIENNKWIKKTTDQNGNPLIEDLVAIKHIKFNGYEYTGIRKNPTGSWGQQFACYGPFTYSANNAVIQQWMSYGISISFENSCLGD